MFRDGRACPVSSRLALVVRLRAPESRGVWYFLQSAYLLLYPLKYERHSKALEGDILLLVFISEATLKKRLGVCKHPIGGSWLRVEWLRLKLVAHK